MNVDEPDADKDADDSEPEREHIADRTLDDERERAIQLLEEGDIDAFQLMVMTDRGDEGIEFDGVSGCSERYRAGPHWFRSTQWLLASHISVLIQGLDIPVDVLLDAIKAEIQARQRSEIARQQLSLDDMTGMDLETERTYR